MTGQGTRCVSCGAFFHGAETSCTFCHVARPREPLGETHVRAVVRDELQQDRNHNGVPDVLEQGFAPRVVPAPQPTQAALPPWKPVAIMGVISLTVFCVILPWMMRAKQAATTAHAAPVPTVTTVSNASTTAAETTITPAPTLPTTATTARSTPRAAPPSPAAPPAVAPAAPPPVAPAPRPQPVACRAARDMRARGNGPAATLAALDNACRNAGGDPGM